ncbi:MAG: bifunctional folylpolyglutamate synthase/dihydrofolate synthase [Calditrichaeota bacterium]|nr:bifunctional folylpolyglutamate synthase/dihydrofolate synthase [Calditrichota bacterium]
MPVTHDLSGDALTRYLFSLRRFGVRLGLENIFRLLAALQHPQRKFRAVHIAGTNGKGSTGAMIASILQTAGWTTGLYVSPHLVSFQERIRVNNRWIPIDAVQLYLNQLLSTIETYHCTFFEVMTAIAFAYFADKNVDIAVVETGLGGRLDATNVLHPMVSVITEIDLDHTGTLGGNIRDIAREKAGIIKENTPVVTSAHHADAIEVFETICAERHSPLHPVVEECRYADVKISLQGTSFRIQTPEQEYKSVHMPLHGIHQICNAIAAVRTAELLNDQGTAVSRSHILDGLGKTYWPGRFEIYWNRPTLILDIAHNPNGLKQLVRTFDHVFPGQTFILMMGVLADKNFEAMVDELLPKTREAIAVQPNNPRALRSEMLAEVFRKKGVPARDRGTIKNGLADFFKRFSKEDILVITGSNYTVSDALLELRKL